MHERIASSHERVPRGRYPAPCTGVFRPIKRKYPRFASITDGSFSSKGGRNLEFHLAHDDSRLFCHDGDVPHVFEDGSQESEGRSCEGVGVGGQIHLTTNDPSIRAGHDLLAKPHPHYDLDRKKTHTTGVRASARIMIHTVIK